MLTFSSNIQYQVLCELVLRGTTVLPRHRGTIFLRYQYRRLYGTI